METFDLLQKLTETPGPSGFENDIGAVVQELWEPLTDELIVDRLGSVVAVKHGRGEAPRRRLLLAAHMDEIGLMVKQIVAYPEEGGHGFLRLTNLGGVDIRHLYGQKVLVHGSRGEEPRTFPGVIGALPVAMIPEERQKKPYGYDDLVVDIGLSEAELKSHVSIGDPISFRQPLRKLIKNRASGKALDNRASVAAVTLCLEYLQGRHHQWDVVAVATIQEETRLLGAATSAFAQKPDAAIAIDVTFAAGPGSSDPWTFEMGDGVPIGFGPNVHPGMFAGLRDAAKAMEMTPHLEPHSRASGTDAYALQVAREGIPTGLVGIPLRYMHTMVETVDLSDIERAGRLLGEFAARLDTEFLDKIAQDMMSDK